MRQGYNLRFIRNILYRLKRDYGSSVDIYYEQSDSVNLQTGQRLVSIQSWHVNRAIPLPRKVEQKSILATALEELFSRGGNVTLGDRQIIIDRSDLPRGFVIGLENWYIVYEGRRYQILSSENYEHDLAYIVTLRETIGAERDAANIVQCIFDNIAVTEKDIPPLVTGDVLAFLQDNVRVVQTNTPAALEIGTDVSIMVVDNIISNSNIGGN